MVTASKPATRLTALLGLSAVWLFLWCTPVWGHAELLETEPEDGAALAEAPEQVRLQFNEPIEAEFNPLEVRDQQGNRADEDNARVDPDDARILVADLKALPAGSYTVEWRITSVDGHVVGDTFDFNVTASDVSELPDDPVEPASESSGSGVARMAIIGILGLSIAAALGVVLRRRR
jgi:methionine-rich copper-binding protein CopC